MVIPLPRQRFANDMELCISKLQQKKAFMSFFCHNLIFGARKPSATQSRRKGAEGSKPPGPKLMQIVHLPLNT